MYKLGIDIGYSTFKYILLNDCDKVIKKGYFFHKGQVGYYYNQLVKEMEAIEVQELAIGIVGELASRLNLHRKYSINHVIALVEGAHYKNRGIQSIIEMGAQGTHFINHIDSKRNDLKFYTNSNCAAGTGAFLEEQATRLDIPIDRLSEYTSQATSIPRIAGRCSVFSKTDMIHHMQDGVAIDDILLGLCYAFVRNYKANVIQKNEVQKPVLLAGGVMHNEGIIRAIKDIFKFKEEDIVLEDDHDFIACYGACKKAYQNAFYVKKAELNTFHEIRMLEKKVSTYPPLKTFGKEDSMNKQECISKAKEGYLGIDIGSTSVNLVVVDEVNQVIDYIYTKTEGRPKEVVLKNIEKLQERLGKDFKFKGIGTTGSGRVMIGKLVNADFVVNEITAQAKGATVVQKNIDTIFEIGGQDSKYIHLNKGLVHSFEMNKICAAGTGAFIEEQVKKLGITITEFSDYALNGTQPCNLGDRCTVFIESNIGKAIAEGEKIEDICAGLAYSIVKNYLNRVVGNRKIGNKILLQGGIAYNQGVINAFRALLGKEVIVPEFFSVTGALGMAVLTKEHLQEGVFEKQVVTNIKEKGEQYYLEHYKGEIDSNKKTVGIPRVLFMNKMFPMFNEIFSKLGYNIILSEVSSEEIIGLSQEYAFEETCFPVKLITGHFAWLIKQNVDYIFLPKLHTMKHEGAKARENYACVYMQTAPKIMESIFDFKEKGIELITPILDFNLGKKYMIDTLLSVGQQLGKSKVETFGAIMSGMKKFISYEKNMELLGKQILDNVTPNQKVFVLISRVYNIVDPTLNMGIENKLVEMGYNVLHLGHLEANTVKIKKEYSNMCWPFGQHILTGLEEIKKHKHMFPIYITNHGCGPDTIISHYFKEEMEDKPYLHIEIDEHSSKIGILTRLEAFVHSINQYEPVDKVNCTVENQIDKSSNKAYLLPNIPLYSQVLKLFLEEQGYQIILLDEVNQHSIETGKAFAMSKEYFSMIAVVSEVLEKIKYSDETYKLYFPITEGNETFGQYAHIIKIKAKEMGKRIEIESPFLEDFLGDERFGFRFVKAIIGCDLINLLPAKERSQELTKLLETLQKQELEESYLIALSRRVRNQIRLNSSSKRLMIIGEPLVVYKSYLNHGLIDELEETHYVMKQPLAEVLYFLWYDFSHKRNNKNKKYINLLKVVQKLFNEINTILEENTPYSVDIQREIEMINNILPIYSGGAGRYRLAKLLNSRNAEGIIAVSSMYENTETILKMIREKYREKESVPILALSFDYNKKDNNNEVLDTFLTYL